MAFRVDTAGAGYQRDCSWLDFVQSFTVFGYFDSDSDVDAITGSNTIRVIGDPNYANAYLWIGGGGINGKNLYFAEVWNGATFADSPNFSITPRPSAVFDTLPIRHWYAVVHDAVAHTITVYIDGKFLSTFSFTMAAMTETKDTLATDPFIPATNVAHGPEGIWQKTKTLAELKIESRSHTRVDRDQLLSDCPFIEHKDTVDRAFTINGIGPGHDFDWIGATNDTPYPGHNVNPVGAYWTPGPVFTIPKGSIVFDSYGDHKCRFTTPNGIELSYPLSAMKAGCADDPLSGFEDNGNRGICAFASGAFATAGAAGPGPTGPDNAEVFTFKGAVVSYVPAASAIVQGGCYPDGRGYVYMIDSNIGAGSNKRVRKIDARGNVVHTFTLATSGQDPNAITVNKEGTRLYYVVFGTSAQMRELHAYDLVNEVNLGVIFTAPSTVYASYYQCLMVLQNGEILVAWRHNLTTSDGYVGRYSTAGSELQTYPYATTNVIMGAGLFPHVDVTVSPARYDDASFWMNGGSPTADYGTRLAQINVATGAVMRTWDPPSTAPNFYPGEDDFEWDGQCWMTLRDILAPYEQEFEDGTVSHPEHFVTAQKVGGFEAFAEVDLNDRESYYYGYKAPTVLSWSKVHRGDSDKRGQLEHMTGGCVVDDRDRLWHTRMDTEYLNNRPIAQYAVDDEVRRLEGLARMTFNGHIGDFGPLPDFQFRLGYNDWLRRKSGRTLDGSLTWQPRFLSANFDPNGTPLGVLDKPGPIPVGPISDKNEATTADTVHTVYLRDATLPAGVVTGAGTQDRRYFLTAMNGQYGNAAFQAWIDHRGETMGVYVDVAACPTDQTFSDQAAAGGAPANYVTVSATFPDAPTLVRVYRGDTNGSNAKALGFAADMGAGVWQFVDGMDDAGNAAFYAGFEGTPPAKNNTYIAGTLLAGNVTTDTGSGKFAPIYTGPFLCPDGKIRSEFIFSMAPTHVPPVPDLYVGGVRLSDGEVALDWLVPGTAEWTAALFLNLYIEKNGFRYMAVYCNRGKAINLGVVSTNEQAVGATLLTMNFDGVEDVGDCSGDLIENLFLQALWFADNAVAPDRPLNTQDWVGDAPIEFTLIPGLPRVDREAFMSLAALYPDVKGVGAIGYNFEEVRFEDVLARFCVSGDFGTPFNRFGQLSAIREPDAVPEVPASHVINDVVHIIDRSATVEALIHSDFFNVWQWRYAQDYSGRSSGGSIMVGGLHLQLPASGDWKTGTDQDTASQSNNDAIVLDKIDFYFLEDPALAQAVIDRRKRRFKNPRVQVKLAISLQSTSIEVGDVFLCTNIEGPGAAGFVNQPLRCDMHDLDCNRNVGEVRAYDIGRVLA